MIICVGASKINNGSIRTIYTISMDAVRMFSVSIVSTNKHTPEGAPSRPPHRWFVCGELMKTHTDAPIWYLFIHAQVIPQELGINQWKKTMLPVTQHRFSHDVKHFCTSCRRLRVFPPP